MAVSLEIECAGCGEELDKPGGLLFSPPSHDLSMKRHLCVDCYEKVRATISQIREWAAAVRNQGADREMVENPDVLDGTVMVPTMVLNPIPDQKHCECGNRGRHPRLHERACPVAEDYYLDPWPGREGRTS